MSKTIIISVEKEYRELLIKKLTKNKIIFKKPHLIPVLYTNMVSVQLVVDFGLSYYCRNRYEINKGTPQKDEFGNFIVFLKDLLKDTFIKVHLCLQWDGNDATEINDVYDQKEINLFSFVFPEDEFEFEFNVDYVFVYEE